MNIHITVVAYGLADDLRKLFDSADGPDVTWHIFLHSQFPDVMRVCYDLAARGNVWLYPYGRNRGLARSWNDGLYDSYADGADVALIANDDAVAGSGDVDRIAQAALANRDKYLVSGIGHDLHEDRLGNMLLALAAINPVALETIGYFDTNFQPIYYEDIDYYRRAKLAGLEALCVGFTHIVHAGSKSLHQVPGQQDIHAATFHVNRAYYSAKWGGDNGEETYERPFGEPEASLYEAYTVPQAGPIYNGLKAARA